MAKVSSKSVSTHVLIASLVVMVVALVIGCYFLANANATAVPIIGVILTAYVGLAIKGLLAQVLQRLSQRAIEDDTETTVKIATAVNNDLKKTEEVKKEVETVKQTVQTAIVNKLDEVKAVAVKAELNTNGGLEYRMMLACWKVLELKEKGLPLPPPPLPKEEVPDAKA